MLKRVLIVIAVALMTPGTGLASGVTPYLPLSLEPEVERQIERVLILADAPVMSRPIPAAKVLAALPKACKIDAMLCTQVRRYLARYMHKAGITYASLEGATSSGKGDTAVEPNRYGMREDSQWNASVQGYWQPGDYLLVDVGAVAYQGETSYTGSMVSFGADWAQLDVGYRTHWFSPMSDSSMLMSSEAPTMPSWTLSNYEPLTRLGITYQVFEARMSHSDKIAWQDGYTSGHPLLGGLQLAFEPADGWSLAFNRLVQFGGGARGSGSLKNLLRALFKPSSSSNTSSDNLNADVSNQEASITSSLIFPGSIPFAVYAEYAGEDTSHGRNYLLGNTSLSWGIHLPRLFKTFDLTIEASEWQNGWYVNSVYQDGMTNYGLVTGNWFGDQRQFNDGVGGRSAMLGLGWDAWFGGHAQLRYRTLQNEDYGTIAYKHYHELSIAYSRPWSGMVFGGELDAGRDVYGNSFTRLAGFVRLGDSGAGAVSAFETEGGTRDPANQLFVEAGASSMHVSIDLTGTTPKTTSSSTGPHFGVGARRAVSDHSDLGARVEDDQVDGHSLLGVRLLDYRYRFGGPLALGVFLGTARYDLATPAYGFYYGLGLQWRDILPHIDLGLEGRYYNNVARDHLLPSDPHSTRPDSFYNISGLVLSLSYHF